MTKIMSDDLMAFSGKICLVLTFAAKTWNFLADEKINNILVLLLTVCSIVYIIYGIRERALSVSIKKKELNKKDEENL